MKNAATALIVDDSPSMRLVLRITLQNAGYEVTEASNGREALASAARQKFDFVITDLNMPEMDGVELVKALRADSSYRFTPILTLTNANAELKKQQVRDAGATGWIQKPFEPGSLVNVLNKVAA
ncbi:MAG: response regulator [Gammaproteobacteria bacterium]|nr:response regulator [Gammaproteobacteria bacterium]MDH5650427.1 response regulator [Gammaproteobacteria bacterium]